MRLIGSVVTIAIIILLVLVTIIGLIAVMFLTIMVVCIINVFIRFGSTSVVICVDIITIVIIIIKVIIITIIIIITSIIPIGFIIIILIIASTFNKRVTEGESTILSVNAVGGSTWSGSEGWVHCVRVFMQYRCVCVYGRAVPV